MKYAVETITFNRYNNIEWLRLVFAVQVMLVHVFHALMGITIPFLSHFPGVPAFFFTSGFLIYASYKKSTSIKAYFINRFLRLFPALFVVSIAALLLAIIVKGTGHLIEYNTHYFAWFVGQISLGQAYNPAMFRDIGVGVLNGSLWTITVEILFYFTVPFIILLERSIRHILAVFFILSFSLFALGPNYLNFEVTDGKTLFEFLKLTPLVWGWMFLAGSLCYKYFDLIKPVIGKFWIAVLPMCTLIFIGRSDVFFASEGNNIGLIYFSLYMLIILYMAFAVKYIPLNIDLSYGIYIWHMIVVNVLLVTNTYNVILAILLTILISLVSWFAVEKPALKLKKYSLKRLSNR